MRKRDLKSTSFLQGPRAREDIPTENRPCTLSKPLRLFVLLSSTTRTWEVMNPRAPGYEEAFKVLLSHRLLVPRLEGALHIGCCLGFTAQEPCLALSKEHSQLPSLSSTPLAFVLLCGIGISLLGGARCHLFASSQSAPQGAAAGDVAGAVTFQNCCSSCTGPAGRAWGLSAYPTFFVLFIGLIR